MCCAVIFFLAKQSSNKDQSCGPWHDHDDVLRFSFILLPFIVACTRRHHWSTMRTRSQTRNSKAAATDNQVTTNAVQELQPRKRRRKTIPKAIDSAPPKKVPRVTECTIETCVYLRKKSNPQTKTSDSQESEAEYQNKASEAIEQLIAAESRFGELVEKFGKPEFCRRDVFSSLIQAIVFQQISGHAGRAIWSRFLGLVGQGDEGDIVTPCCLVGRSVEELREVGLSRRKAGYMLGIAEYFHGDDWNEGEVESLEDEEIIERLVRLKGVGRWTVHMILMFSLRRMDVLPFGDLGVRKGATIMFGNGGNAPMEENKLVEVFEKFRGYRSFGSYYMWKLKNKDFKVPNYGGKTEIKVEVSN